MSVDLSVDDVHKLIELLDSDDDLRRLFVSCIRKPLPWRGERVKNKDVSSCSFCGDPILYAKGMCRNCYTRARLHGGDPSYVIREKKAVPVVKKTWQEKLATDIFKIPVEGNNNLNEFVERAVGTLNLRLSKVIKLRYIQGLTLDECGELFGVSRERIRQLQQKSLRILRNTPDAREYYKHIIGGDATL